MSLFQNNTNYYLDSESNQTEITELDHWKFLYSKEIERSKIIVDKTVAGFFMFAADSGFFAANIKIPNDYNLQFWICVSSIIFIILAAFSLVFSLKNLGKETRCFSCGRSCQTPFI